MTEDRANPAALAGYFAEFTALADHLDMPSEERRLLAGVPEDAWPHVIRPGGVRFLTDPAYLRKLSYVVPLMRRTLANR